MGSKGQGSAEYLIVLAAVLIVALVAIMLLGGFPAFGSDARVTESSQYWRGTARPFSIQEQNQINSTLLLSIQNMETDRLVIMSINITGFSGNDSIPNAGATMGSGARKVFNVSGLTPCNAVSYDEYEYEIRIYYNVSGIMKTQTGTKPLIGKCIAS